MSETAIDPVVSRLRELLRIALEVGSLWRKVALPTEIYAKLQEACRAEREAWAPLQSNRAPWRNHFDVAGIKLVEGANLPARIGIAYGADGQILRVLDFRDDEEAST